MALFLFGRPGHTEHEELLEWAGPIDPEAFDLQEAEQRVARLRKSRKQKALAS